LKDLIFYRLDLNAITINQKSTLILYQKECTTSNFCVSVIIFVAKMKYDLSRFREAKLPSYIEWCCRLKTMEYSRNLPNLKDDKHFDSFAELLFNPEEQVIELVPQCFRYGTELKIIVTKLHCLLKINSSNSYFFLSNQQMTELHCTLDVKFEKLLNLEYIVIECVDSYFNLNVAQWVSEWVSNVKKIKIIIVTRPNEEIAYRGTHVRRKRIPAAWLVIKKENLVEGKGLRRLQFKGQEVRDIKGFLFSYPKEQELLGPILPILCSNPNSFPLCLGKKNSKVGPI